MKKDSGAKDAYNAQADSLAACYESKSFEEIHQEVRRALENHFRDNDVFSVSKNVLGICFEF